MITSSKLSNSTTQATTTATRKTATNWWKSCKYSWRFSY